MSQNPTIFASSSIQQPGGPVSNVHQPDIISALIFLHGQTQECAHTHTHTHAHKDKHTRESGLSQCERVMTNHAVTACDSHLTPSTQSSVSTLSIMLHSGGGTQSSLRVCMETSMAIPSRQFVCRSSTGCIHDDSSLQCMQAFNRCFCETNRTPAVRGGLYNLTALTGAVAVSAGSAQDPAPAFGSSTRKTSLPGNPHGSSRNCTRRVFEANLALYEGRSKRTVGT